MTDYNALKVPELKAMLGQRKLLQAGNKPALIARLQEDDEKAAPGDTSKADEITYSEDEVATEKPAAEKPAAEEPVTVAESKSEEPAKTEEAPASADAAAEKKEVAENAPSYAIGLASTAADDEAKKRAERAKRFGIEEDDAAKKRAERAKRFGLDQKDLASALDSALPERPLKRGRGREVDTRSGKRQSVGRRGHHGRGPRRSGNQEGGVGVLGDAAEKAKAERRAARFAAA
ncbi:hypothetical protein ED733_005663 [Metarhizium rileyi]|uniref:SAP domain-containing protein n=1 Tax=Metarhizium rileyi (strain RCEF 4871) TaxID=1649241 RepID=A0A5C6GC32_METRR|nr:hypothetical protein ED733_005663 [Metarhizium rileyi]